MTATSEATSPAPHPRALRRRSAFPAFVCVILAGVLVVALPFVARHLDGSADEFSTRTVPVLPAIGWVICAALAAIVITHRLQLWFTIDEGPVLAVAYDVLPLLLFVAPPIAIAALVSGHTLLAAAAAGLVGYHGLLVIPRLISQRPPAWTRTAPTVRLAVANVFVDNPTPEAAARQLTQMDADIIVIAEATPDFMRTFDEAGGITSHPHRVSDPSDTSDYAVAIASRLPLGPGSAVRDLGPLRIALAEIEVGGVATAIVGMNPRATFDEDGQEIWKEQMAGLMEFVPQVTTPLVVAGDLNSTKFRPEFEELLAIGLSDAIDSLGQAWKPSFSLSSVWPLGALGVIARLDQALVGDDVRALHVHNLKACGSDHLPFVITLAVRPPT